jgi:hypothetical protein
VLGSRSTGCAEATGRGGGISSSDRERGTSGDSFSLGCEQVRWEERCAGSYERNLGGGPKEMSDNMDALHMQYRQQLTSLRQSFLQ